MSEPAAAAEAILWRVGTIGAFAFQLRPGEQGLSVFAPDGLTPPLSEEEVLAAFRPGSVLLLRQEAAIRAAGLNVVETEGAGALPERLRRCHREIRPGDGMTRPQFKQALRRLE